MILAPALNLFGIAAEFNNNNEVLPGTDPGGSVCVQGTHVPGRKKEKR